MARSTSSFISAWCKPIPGITDPLVAEATAVREGVVVALLRGFTRVQIETDCLDVVNFWNSRRTSRSLIAPLLLDIEELAASFTSFDILHVKRHANVLTHLCAKHACTLMVTESWTDSRPSFLLTSLLADDARSSFVE